MLHCTKSKVAVMLNDIIMLTMAAVVHLGLTPQPIVFSALLYCGSMASTPVFSLGVYQRALCPLGFLMCPLGFLMYPLGFLMCPLGYGP